MNRYESGVLPRIGEPKISRCHNQAMTKILKTKNWMFAAIPALVIVFLAIYPQLNLWSAKGSTWQGSYFVSNYDEVAYSAYVNALTNGKPRKYDPFLASETSHESLYSIQFVPAYSIALPASLFGLNTSYAFIILSLLSAAISALFIFWLLLDMTGDHLLSAVGVLLICCLGTAVAFQGELRAWLEGQILIDYLPFLRRYQPGFAFPFFFLFCLSVWRSLGADSRKKGIVYSLLSGIIFSILVFSYFYLWTAAAAWIVLVYLFNLIWNRACLTNLLINLGIFGAIGIASLIPYFKMLSERSPNVDSVQLLARTHLPDFESSSMIIGLIVIIGIAVFARRGRVKINCPRTLFALAFASAPLILFNQQIVTGRSLQPVHYEIFISNYLVLTSVVLFLSLIFELTDKSERGPSIRRTLVYIAIIAAGWGLVEAAGSTKRNSPVADLRDVSIPAIRHIEQQEQLKPAGGHSGVVLAADFVTSDFIPTMATVRPIWNAHSSSAGGLDMAENKWLLYCFLFYNGFSDKDLAEALKAKSFEVTATIFGSERALPALGQRSAPITSQEITAEARLYADFTKNFNRITASSPVLSYVVVPAAEDSNFSNLDKWYVRDGGTVTGLFKVYNVKLRP